MTIHTFYAAAALAVFLSGAAQAQEMSKRGANCVVTDAGLPTPLIGWQKKSSLISATTGAALDAATLSLAQGTIVSLHPTRDVSYVVQPEKPGGLVAHGGMVAFSIADPGTYQVSLSSGAWIDVLKDGVHRVSIAHAPGPKCSPIRKTVAFLLQPGRYVLQISANADPVLTVMVTRVP